MKFIQKNPILILIISFAFLLLFREALPSIHEKGQGFYILILKDILSSLGSQTSENIGVSELSLTLFMFVLISVFILPYSWKQKVWLAIALVISLILFNVLRIAIFYNDSRAGQLFYEQNSFIIYHLFIAILLFLLWTFGLQSEKKLSVSQIKSNLNVSGNFGLGYIFVFSFLLLYLSRFVLQFFPNVTNNTYTFIVDFILQLSKYILHFFNYPAQIEGNRIFDTHTEIIMRFACIGINLLIIYLLFIFITKGKLRSKFFYSLFGIALLILVNAIRVSLLFAFLYDGIPSVSKIDWHDLFNMLVYISIFLLWMKWISMQKEKGNIF